MTAVPFRLSVKDRPGAGPWIRSALGEISDSPASPLQRSLTGMRMVRVPRAFTIYFAGRPLNTVMIRSCALLPGSIGPPTVHNPQGDAVVGQTAGRYYRTGCRRTPAAASPDGHRIKTAAQVSQRGQKVGAPLAGATAVPTANVGELRN